LGVQRTVFGLRRKFKGSIEKRNPEEKMNFLEKTLES